MNKHYLFVAPNVWGKGTSPEEAHKNANYATKSNGHAVCQFTHNDFYVDESGILQCEGEEPTILSASKGLGKALRQSLMNL